MTTSDKTQKEDADTPTRRHAPQIRAATIRTDILSNRSQISGHPVVRPLSHLTPLTTAGVAGDRWLTTHDHLQS